MNTPEKGAPLVVDASPSSSEPDPAPAAAPAAEPPAPAPSPYLGAAVIFVPPINANHPGPVQVPARVVAVHDWNGEDVTILTENGDEYRCQLHFDPVEEVGSGLLAVLERQS